MVSYPLVITHTSNISAGSQDAAVTLAEQPQQAWQGPLFLETGRRKSAVDGKGPPAPFPCERTQISLPCTDNEVTATVIVAIPSGYTWLG